MCGICGQLNFARREPVSPATLRAMTATLVPRGPDDEGFFFDGELGLGFRRLSIIDIDGGHQPMSDAEQSVWVVFNGEIYNFPELRRELEAHGHRFRTRSDTETIVHGYKQWGVGVLQRLNGMFGLAIWDAPSKKLVLARDSMGIKQLYYRVDGGSLWFGSELRPVLAAAAERPATDLTAVSLFLRYRYTPSPFTLYRGIQKLAAGTMAVFEDGRWSLQRWYRAPPSETSEKLTDAQATEELLAIYKRALKRHLLSDVPVGLLLSGGVDSGLLLGLMSLEGRDWPAYTVGYGTELFKDDELDCAGETAAIFGARHVPVKLDRDVFEGSLSRIVSVLEEPVAASSIVPMYYVCERARRDVKVALVGQGPDELFGGYTRHLGVYYGAYWRSAPGWLREAVRIGVACLPRSEALKRGVESLGDADRLERYRRVLSLLSAQRVAGLFQDGAIPDGGGNGSARLWLDLEPEIEGTDELGGFQLLEVRSSLPDELLMYADKMSMSHGLEVRVPFLDREIVEYVGRLPARFKVRFGRRKWLHRRVCSEFLPPAVLNRKKRGFAVNAVDDWLRGLGSNGLDGYLLDKGSRMYEFLAPEAVAKLLAEHRAGRADNHKILFSLVVLEEWLRGSRNKAGPAPEEPVPNGTCVSSGNTSIARASA